ncbi:3-hydroxybenzoate 4-monooxygenase [Kocuria koreensis]|jgi:phenol 2-monooxygenase|uniref:3-hydroxybenzoate 4-monooxygenase n=1 Tax=Rothia koreensis TaxID=592378 RepID=A0A7K1LKK4_9MICC|nr:FAD-binding monooxygenase [Rothia koreensis]MUN55727.1 3-hydroxybenzoate 4-monooxygenase [Rothia koreensis]
MQFHHHGYVSGDPRIEEAAGHGVDRPEELPDDMDVLIVGTGPAGMILAAQLSQFPEVCTRIIERRPGRLEIGQADGIQARSVETFQAFGFANQIVDEAYHITEMCFWKPDPENPENIVRTARPLDDPQGISEFPHLIVNQARVLDYFAEFAAHSPGRITPDYGIEFLDLQNTGEGEYPIHARLRYTAGNREGEERTVRAKYVVGCDGARSPVRSSIGRKLTGDAANHAWGVMDVLANTDFPDIRTKCAIQSVNGSILHIPREGGHLFRMYVDLGEVPVDDNHAVRDTSLEDIIDKANSILHPYSVDVKSVAWHSVYEVGHRLTDKFDDVSEAETGERTPRVFITGDACHTHSAKAGQGMNVSMQDGFNLGWKLGHVLTGTSPEELLSTYSEERQVIAKNLIDFDKEWSTLMAAKPEDLPDESTLEDFYVKTAEFPAGFMTEYTPSLITGGTENQGLASGFPVGKRFKSAKANRVCDANPVHLGHQAVADGRWRIYVFADRPAAGEASRLADFAEWFAHDDASPQVRCTPQDADDDAVFDTKVVYQQPHTDVDLSRVPQAFLPKVGEFGLVNRDKVYATLPDEDIFEERGISRDGAIVVVRPDQYVSAVLPLTDREGLAEFFGPILVER